MAQDAEARLKELEQLALKFLRVGVELKRRIVGQDEYVTALLAGLASGEHVALISPPGTAKSHAVRLLQQMIDGAKLYSVLLNPFITYDQLFGPIDLVKLREGQMVRRWGEIVRSHLVFLDEGFKANPALLNTLLSFLNERVIYDPQTGQAIKVPLLTAVIASNEVPTDEILRALWDRIVIRVYGKYLESAEELREALASTLRITEREPPPKLLKLDEIQRFHQLLREVLDPESPLSKLIVEDVTRDTNIDVIELLHHTVVKPLAELRRRLNEDVLASDRTIIAKMPKVWMALFLLLRTQHLPSRAALEATKRIMLYTAGDSDVVDSIEKVWQEKYGTLYNTVKELDEAAIKLIAAYKTLDNGTPLPQEYIENLVKTAELAIKQARNTIQSTQQDVFTKMLEADIMRVNELIEAVTYLNEEIIKEKAKRQKGLPKTIFS